ncbi:MAG: phage major capsid protein [Cohnella sp.]|nr:phage major capsid protein [Cohnella sp.]
MAVDNLVLADQALKTFYLNGLRNQMNDASVLLAQIERNSENVRGSEIMMALKYGRSGGVGNRRDDADMPTPNPRKRKKATWDTKNIFGHLTITDKTIEASKTSAGAFADLLEVDLEDLATDAKDSLSRQVFGDGTGVVAIITTGVTGVTLTCSAGVDNLSEGQFIDIYDTTLNSQKYAGKEITGVDYDNNQITIAGTNVTVVDTDKIVIAGNLNEELTGLDAVFTPDTTLYNINRSQAANKFFNPVTSALNGEISEVAIQGQIDAVDKRSGSKTNLLSGSYGVRRAYQNLLTATKQTVNVMDLKGGYKVLTYNGMPFTVDKYNPAGTLFGLDMSTWMMCEMDDWDWLSDAAGKVIRVISGTAQWEATLRKYCDLGCDKPRGNWKMTGITEH